MGVMADNTVLLVAVQSCYDIKDWPGLLHLTDHAEDAGSPTLKFHRSRALLELHQLEAAYAAVEDGLRMLPQSEWGTVLKHNILKGLGDLPAAIECLQKFVANYSASASDGVRALLVDQAAEGRRFDLAIAANDARSLFHAHPPVRFAVALQCFAKLATLQRCLQALLHCRQSQNFDLVILQDSLNGLKNPEVYVDGHMQVRDAISALLSMLSSRFHSVTVLQNQQNMGTTASCRRLLDHTAVHASGFVFLEDDCILAPDALEWASYHLDRSIAPQSILIGACESIFFDARNQIPTAEQIADLTKVARRPDYRWAHTLQSFVPSTCFFTTSEIWRGIASIRSFPRGDRHLSMYLREHGLKCLMPVVPRAADIGMLDAMGYSVNTLGLDRVTEKKNTYLQSLDESPDPERMTVFAGHAGELFDASVNLSAAAIARVNAGA